MKTKKKNGWIFKVAGVLCLIAATIELAMGDITGADIKLILAFLNFQLSN